MNDELTTTEQSENQSMEAGAMTPEEMAQLKALMEKKKAYNKTLGDRKEKFFELLTTSYGPAFSKIKKDVVTASLKDAFNDGNIYAITFGVETSDDDSDVDKEALVTDVLDNHLAEIEQLMGIADSVKVAGTFEGNECYWQIRKRKA